MRVRGASVRLRSAGLLFERTLRQVLPGVTAHPKSPGRSDSSFVLQPSFCKSSRPTTPTPLLNLQRFCKAWGTSQDGPLRTPCSMIDATFMKHHETPPEGEATKRR